MFYDCANDYTVYGPAGHYNKWLESESESESISSVKEEEKNVKKAYLKEEEEEECMNMTHLNCVFIYSSLSQLNMSVFFVINIAANIAQFLKQISDLF